MLRDPFRELGKTRGSPRARQRSGASAFGANLHRVVQKAWQRWSFETDAAFAVFAEWLHMSPRPDLNEWAREKATEEDPEATSRILKWAVDGMWPQRAAAYDAELADEIRRQRDTAYTEALEKERAERASRMAERFPTVSPAILMMLRIGLTELRKYQAAQERAGEDSVGFLSMRDTIKLIENAFKVEHAINKLQTKEKIAAEQGEILEDYSKLTLDEQRQLEELHLKARI